MKLNKKLQMHGEELEYIKKSSTRVQVQPQTNLAR